MEMEIMEQVHVRAGMDFSSRMSTGEFQDGMSLKEYPYSIPGLPSRHGRLFARCRTLARSRWLPGSA